MNLTRNQSTVISSVPIDEEFAQAFQHRLGILRVAPEVFADPQFRVPIRHARQPRRVQDRAHRGAEHAPRPWVRSREM
ncbi:MAG: hypothetical protein FJ399_23860 [Verrucomicrobia bacterium]|nr:hypothetical protein [Verrucomicrobiota bacterium]